MSTKELYNELNLAPTGKWAQEYYKWLGFRDGAAEPFSPARARAIHTLFTCPEPYIYKNDTVVGCLRPLFADVRQEDLDEAHKVCAFYGERTFGTNADHFAPDYRTVMAQGIPGMFEKIEASRTAHAEDTHKILFLDDMKVCLLALRDMIAKYADKAIALLGTEGYDDATLTQIAADCRALTVSAPQSFRQALQLMWFCHMCFCYEGRYAMALGRIDQFLYPAYKKDRDAGLLTQEEATVLLENVFMKIWERHAFTGGDDVVNICIGGSDVNGQCEINELSYCVIRAVGNCQVPGPNLSARITHDTPDDFLDECLQTIGTGLGYPALMNDEVNIAALSRYGYAPEDVHDFCMVGCIENLISGRQRPWTDGRFDTPRYFEYLVNNGKGIATDWQGVDTGDVSDIKNMEDLMQKLEIQLRFGAEQYVNGFKSYNHVADPDRYTSPFLSLFCRDCIGRGMDINNGGALYPSVHGAALMGVGTMCDSLAAIEQVVFTNHEATMEDIRTAMLTNFKDMDWLREKLLAAPKYGNNDDRADKYAVWFVDFLANEFSKYQTEDGGGIYIAMAANTSNIWAGASIAATPDGRLQGEPLSDAASPTYGRDTNGVTSTVLSLTKPDYTKVACGTVVNQKFSPAMFKDGKREKLAALLRVYFARGGQEMQINATSRQVLKDAMDHPENYPTMVVRVSGFSAVYVTLPPQVQHDILNRTQQDE